MEECGDEYKDIKIIKKIIKIDTDEKVGYNSGRIPVGLIQERKHRRIEMSAFSEEIRQEIKKSGKTLLYLSGVSGLSLDHISKMRLGKRLPQDEKKVRALIEALECPGQTGRYLLSLYKLEKMGKAEWDCIEELRKLLGFQWGYSWKTSQLSSAMPEQGLRELSVLNSRSEIGEFLMRVMTSAWQNPSGWKRSVLYMMTGEMPTELVAVLAACLKRQECSCEHYFLLMRNLDTESALYNLRFVNRLLPLLKREQYVPFYDYGENSIVPGAGKEYGEHIVLSGMNWIVGERWALGLDSRMESGLVIWEKAQVRYLQRYIEAFCRNGRKLWKPQADMDMEAGKASGQGEAETNTDAYCLSDFPYQLLQRRNGRTFKSFFTLDGLESFIKTGYMPESIKRACVFLPEEERRSLAKEYLMKAAAGEEPCAVVDSTLLSLARGICWQLEKSSTGYSVCVCVNEDTGKKKILNESGISERVCRLFQLMETGEFLLSREECEDEIRRLVEL